MKRSIGCATKVRRAMSHEVPTLPAGRALWPAAELDFARPCNRGRHSGIAVRKLFLCALLAFITNAQAQSGNPADQPQSEISAYQAQGGIPAYMEYRKRVESAQNIAPLDAGLLGERVSLFDGSTAFSVSDIDLPGNDALAVRLDRRLAIELLPQSALSDYDTRLSGLGNWDVDVPYISMTYPNRSGWPTRACSQGILPPSNIDTFFMSEYWSGVGVHIPGRPNSSVLGLFPDVPRPSDGITYRFGTSERDVFSCIAMQSGLAGEGFRMTTSSGVRYYFDRGFKRTDSTLRKVLVNLSGESRFEILARTRYYLLASKIEDRFGNTVEYQYDPDGHPTRIWSGDGREISLHYSGGRLASAASGGRTWDYEYDSEGNLTAVILPDGGRWQYSYTGTLLPRAPSSPEDDATGDWCSREPSGVSSSYRITAKHPSGATGLFLFANLRHYRSGVHANECMQEYPDDNPDVPVYTLLTPNFFDVMSLMRKEIAGTGLGSLVWLYDYGISPLPLWGSHDQPSVYPCTTCARSKRVVVTNPNGSKLRQSYGILYWANEGRLLQSESLSETGSILSSEVVDYLPDADAPDQAFFGQYGAQPGRVSDPSTTWVRPVIKRSVTQQGNSFVWEVSKSCVVRSVMTYCFDIFANPTKTGRSGF